MASMHWNWLYHRIRHYEGIGWLAGIALVVLVSAIVASVDRTYHYFRGRRNHDRGIPCIQCQRTAFPLEGSVTRYRCGICGCRFEGPEHF
jgi:hypothetical protein